nr:copper-transporting ATPase PAA1, chloroplastic [Tanacetum cinerariifolium]
DAKDEVKRRKQQEKAGAKGPCDGRKAKKPTRKPAARKVTVTPIYVECMETSSSSPMETSDDGTFMEEPGSGAVASIGKKRVQLVH